MFVDWLMDLGGARAGKLARQNASCDRGSVTQQCFATDFI